jgi:hypothetical protein
VLERYDGPGTRGQPAVGSERGTPGERRAGGAAVIVAALALALGAGGVAPAQPEPSVVVWAVGDGADGTAPARRLARRIERDGPDAVPYLGDVYPSGTAADYARNYEPIYGDLAAIT